MKPKHTTPERIEAICQYLDVLTNRLLKIRSDPVFKGTIGEKPYLAAQLLNEILPIEPGAKVVKVDFLDPHLRSPEVKDSKADISDVRDRDYIQDLFCRVSICQGEVNKKTYSNLLLGWEMQTDGPTQSLKRWIVYLCRLFSGQTKKGDPIGLEKPSCILVFSENKLDFLKKFGDIEEGEHYHEICLCLKRHPSVTFDEITLLFVELGSFDKLLDDLTSVRDCIIYTIKYSEKLRRKDVVTLIQKGGDIVAELIDTIYSKSIDREFIDSLRMYRLPNRDDELQRQAWVQEGMQKGIQKGQQNAKKEIAKAFLASGIAQDVIAQNTGLSSKVIAKLAKEIEDSFT